MTYSWEFISRSVLRDSLEIPEKGLDFARSQCIQTFHTTLIHLHTTDKTIGHVHNNTVTTVHLGLTRWTSAISATDEHCRSSPIHTWMNRQRQDNELSVNTTHARLKLRYTMERHIRHITRKRKTQSVTFSPSRRKWLLTFTKIQLHNLQLQYPITS